MAFNVKIQGNFFVIYDLVEDRDIIRSPRSNVRYFFSTTIVNPSYTFLEIENSGNDFSTGKTVFYFQELIDDRTGVVFTSNDELNEFLSLNIGGIGTPVYSGVPLNFVFVTTKSDFPTPVANSITLADNTSYFITKDIDLIGDKLVSGQNSCLLGPDSENASITSTGLGATTALITSTKTITLRFITIKDVGTALDLNGSGASMVINWSNVNFTNITTIGTIKNAINVLYNQAVFKGSQGLSFDGTFETISFSDFRFEGNGVTADDIVRLESTTIINSRFKIISSVVNSDSPNTGINVESGITIGSQNFILDKVIFTGTGIYLNGLDYTSNKTLFKDCEGITNTNEIGEYYMNDNATVTVISTIATPVKILGTTIPKSFNQKFNHTNNRLTFIGSKINVFKISCALSITSGNNKDIGIYIYKNRVEIDSSSIVATTNGIGKAQNLMTQTLLLLTKNDYIEVWLENRTGVTDVTVTDLNLIIK